MLGSETIDIWTIEIRTVDIQTNKIQENLNSPDLLNPNLNFSLYQKNLNFLKLHYPDRNCLNQNWSCLKCFRSQSPI